MWSVACTRPPVSFQTSQESTVPNASSALRRADVRCSIHSSLLAEK